MVERVAAGMSTTYIITSRFIKCIDKGYYCYGYEFQKNPSSWLGYGKCEVWKVPIDKLKLEYVNGLDCYIKMQG